MKKLLYIICAIFLLSSCTRNKNENGAFTTDTGLYYSLGLVDICFDNETHQYVMYKDDYGKSLSHWAGCKYCKQLKDSLK